MVAQSSHKRECDGSIPSRPTKECESCDKFFCSAKQIYRYAIYDPPRCMFCGREVVKLIPWNSCIRHYIRVACEDCYTKNDGQPYHGVCGFYPGFIDLIVRDYTQKYCINCPTQYRCITGSP